MGHGGDRNGYGRLALAGDHQPSGRRLYTTSPVYVSMPHWPVMIQAYRGGNGSQMGVDGWCGDGWCVCVAAHTLWAEKGGIV